MVLPGVRPQCPNLGKLGSSWRRTVYNQRGEVFWVMMGMGLAFGVMLCSRVLESVEAKQFRLLFEVEV